MLLYCLRCTLKPSASATVISKLYQHFRVRDHPYGLQNSLPTLRPSCSQHISMQLRHGPKARYGWVANPYRKPFLAFSRQGLSPCKIRRALLGAITTSSPAANMREKALRKRKHLCERQHFKKNAAVGGRGERLVVNPCLVATTCFL